MSAWIVRGTIWIALLAFVAAEGGRWWAARRRRPVSWGPRVFLLGALVCAAHVVAAMHWHHAWSHARAVAFTAEQTNAVYGVPWGGGFWVNYIFLGVWLADAIWWLAHLRETIAPASRARWSLRAFYAIVIVNAAVVFTTGFAQLVGAILVGVLFFFWWSGRALQT